MNCPLRPYPRYRTARMPWLGCIPAHWDVGRGKSLFRRVERPVYADDEVVTCFRDGVVTRRRNRRTDGFTEALKEVGYQRVHVGDLVIHGMDAFAGAVGVADSAGKCTPVYAVCVPSGAHVDAKYFALCVREMARSNWILALSKGIRERSTDFRFSMFGSQLLPLPPHEEQTAIVRFLDHIDRQIWRYLRAKEKLIALLEEQKRAVVHRVVTGQIDVRTGRRYSAYKDSGKRWIGFVPQHWSVSRVRAEFDCLNHRRVPLSGTERGTMKLRTYDYYGASGVIDKVDSYLFDDDLLLIAEDGANLVLRNLRLAIIARGRFWVNNHAHVLKPRRGNLEYLASVMEGLDYAPWISGAAQPKLTQDRLLNIAIAVPSREEQDRIALFAQKETAGIRAATRRARREVELVREYRTRLVADVVTGKLDVREMAAELPGPDPMEVGDALDDFHEVEPNLDELGGESIAGADS